MLTKLQDCLATAAELDMSKAQRCSLADLLSLCLVSLAYISELSLSKDPSNLGQMASGLADPLTDTIMKVQKLAASTCCSISTYLKTCSGVVIRTSDIC